MAFICLLTGSVLSALQVVIIQRTAAQNLNWDPKGYTLQLFLGIYRHRKMYKRKWGEESGCPNMIQIQTLSLCVVISVYKSVEEKNTKAERMKEVKRVFFPCMRYCQGVCILTQVLPVVATVNSS